MKLPSPSLVMALFLAALSVGCQRKTNNPLLGTPDANVTEVEMFVRGVDNTQPPEVSVLLQSVANASIRMTDLTLANFAVLQDEIPVIPTRFERAVGYPFAVMLVIDRSGSMESSFGGNTRTIAANDAATTFLNALPPSAQAGLVEFESVVQLKVPMTTDKNAVAATVNITTMSAGGTALYDAIITGAQELSKATGYRLLVVITDGADTASSHTAADAAGALQGIGTVANGVIVGGDVSDTAIMQAILEPTGGTVSTSLDPTELSNQLNATLTNGDFDDIYKLTFRRRSSEPNIRVYVSYGPNTHSIDLSVYR
ncbi:MAG: VWA domain-containing protein [Elusimicrobia bacterium]|nr:VWA domain-containing protein [Elusimicrobiota bacterium]